VIPNLTVLRPGDANETIEAWRIALENASGPTALVLTRQNLPVCDRLLVGAADGVRSGGYVFIDSVEGETPEVILIGTGSELQLAAGAGRMLASEGIRVRVVSMPSWELFDAQTDEYRNAVLPFAVKARVAVEAGVRLGWERYVGTEGAVVGIDHFGASAPYQVLYEKFGITAERIAAEARRLLKKG
jgi:transketolase